MNILKSYGEWRERQAQRMAGVIVAKLELNSDADYVLVFNKALVSQKAQRFIGEAIHKHFGLKYPLLVSVAGDPTRAIAAVEFKKQQ